MIQHLPSNVDVGTARLVRLWPFAVQRTRGNAAVAVELNTDDERGLLTFLDEYWKGVIQPLYGVIETSEHSSRKQYPSDPGMVWFSESINDSNFYRKGLRKEITIDELPKADRSWGGLGRIGATLAIYWPAVSKTYEAIVNATHAPEIDVAMMTMTVLKELGYEASSMVFDAEGSLIQSKIREFQEENS